MEKMLFQSCLLGACIRSWCSQFVNEKVWVTYDGAAQATKHRIFILFHLGASLFAMLLLPIFWATNSQPVFVESLSFFWFVSPLMIAAYLSYSGSYGVSSLLSIANLISALTFGAIMVESLTFVIIAWLIMVFFGAFFIGGYKLALSAIPLIGVSFLLLMSVFQINETLFVQSTDVLLLSLLPMVLAIFSAAGMIIGTMLCQQHAHAALRVLYEDMGQIIDETADLLTRHSLDGRVTHVSAAAMRLFSILPATLHGDGMLEHVHPADRSRFLKAIACAGFSGQSIEYRIYCGVVVEEHFIDSRFIWVESVCRSGCNDGCSVFAVKKDVVLATRNIHARKMREHAKEALLHDALLNQVKNVQNQNTEGRSLDLQFIDGLRSTDARWGDACDHRSEHKTERLTGGIEDLVLPQRNHTHDVSGIDVSRTDNVQCAVVQKAPIPRPDGAERSVAAEDMSCIWEDEREVSSG